MFDEHVAKNIKAISFAVLSLAALLYVYQFGRSVNQTYPNRTFSVDGEGKIENAPNVAKFSVSVVTEGGSNVSDLQKKNSEKMNAVNEFLKEQGVEKKDLQTEIYALNPRYDYPSCEERLVCPAPVIFGYTITQSLNVKVRDTEKLGGILSGVVEKGANTVSNVNFVLDDDKEAKNQARAEAMQEARKKAEAIAKSAGFRVGKLVSVYENMGDDFSYGGEGKGGMDLAKSSTVAPTIEPGTNETKVSVTMTFEIVQ